MTRARRPTQEERESTSLYQQGYDRGFTAAQGMAAQTVINLRAEIESLRGELSRYRQAIRAADDLRARVRWFLAREDSWQWLLSNDLERGIFAGQMTYCKRALERYRAWRDELNPKW
jgi:hypothetical protein